MRFFKGKIYAIGGHGNTILPMFGYYSHSEYISEYISMSGRQEQVKYFYTLCARKITGLQPVI
jgi:malate/lactate dehydrogenase